jgi:hypothetical protein
MTDMSTILTQQDRPDIVRMTYKPGDTLSILRTSCSRVPQSYDPLRRSSRD